MQGPDVGGIFLAILPGIPVTLFLTALGLIFGFVLGLSLALLRVYVKDWAFIAEGYEKIVRGVPLLVLIYIFYFGFPEIFAFIPAFLRAFFLVSLALGISTAAYQSQILRGAILSVDPGQVMAARALGMTFRQAQLYVVLPQALRVALPPWTNEYAGVIKDASYAMSIGILEVMRLAYNLTANNPSLAFPTYLVVGILYFVFTYPVTNFLGERQTKKLRKLGMGGK